MDLLCKTCRYCVVNTKYCLPYSIEINKLELKIKCNCEYYKDTNK